LEYNLLDILVVDDQSGVRFLLDAIIREEGHNSHLAANGLEGVEMVQKINPDLVFMDIKMPIMDGTVAVEKIKEMGYTPYIVIMTAFTEKDVMEKAIQNGVSKYLIKPFDIQEIRNIICNLAQKSITNHAV
jgi:two-component system response regulator (stage 0 sporulation protein F)